MRKVRHPTTVLGICLLLACKLRVMEPAAEPQQPSAMVDGEGTRVAAPKVPPPCEPAPFHMVARSVTGIRLLVPGWDGNLIVVSAHDSVAGARAGERALEQDAEWVRFQDKHEFMVYAVGGQWPDAVYITGEELVAGPNAPPEVVVRNSGEWKFLGLPSSPGTVSVYSSYHSLADGRVLAVRVEKPEENWWAGPDKKGAIGAVRDKAPRKLAPPAWDVLIGAESPKPPPPPRGGDVLDLKLLPDGGFVMLLPGLKVFRAMSGNSQWTALPPPDPDFEAYPHGLLAVGDDGQVYVAGCGDPGPLVAHWNGSHWEKIALPVEHCLYALMVTNDGALWISQDGLHRRHTDGDWKRVPITVGGFPEADDDIAEPFMLGDTLWVNNVLVDNENLLVTAQAGWSALDLDVMVGQSAGGKTDVVQRCY